MGPSGHKAAGTLTVVLVGLALSVIAGSSARGQPAFNPDPAVVPAGAYELDPLHAKVTWTTSHFGLSHYSGQLVDLNGRLSLDPKEPERATLHVTIPMDRGGAFSANLDERLRTDFFDVYPTATFSSTRIERVGERQVRVTGSLTLKGVTKPVTFMGTFNAAGIHPVSKRYTIGFDGEGSIKRSEFGVIAFPTIGDDVRLAIEAEFRVSE